MRATRRELIRRGGIAAGALASAGLATARADAASQAPQTDAELLARTLRIEQLVVFVYVQVLGAGVLDSQLARQVRGMLSQEREHVEFLEGALHAIGATPPPPPANTAEVQAYLNSHQVHRSLTGIRTQHDGMKLLIDAESLAEGAYFYAISRLNDLNLVRRAVEIMGCEAQHWAVLSAIQHPDQIIISVPYPFVEGSGIPSS
jgi:Ferritin-like domain